MGHDGSVVMWNVFHMSLPGGLSCATIRREITYTYIRSVEHTAPFTQTPALHYPLQMHA